MSAKTERILTILKILALLGAIGYSIECGSQLLSFVASFINPGWAKRTYHANPDIFALRDRFFVYYVYSMVVVIALSALKATVWYVMVDLLTKLRLSTPFSIGVAVKLKRISSLLLVIWLIGLTPMMYVDWLSKTAGIQLPGLNIADEYLFIAGIVYIIYQIFMRGIEMQEENQLTV